MQVPRDVDALAVMGAADDPRVLVYLPGKCGDPFAPIRSFPNAARAHGTLVVVQGDIPCPHSTRRRWGSDITAVDARVAAAVSAVSTARGGVALDGKTMTVLGYSEGALRAESLASRFPTRYPRAVILASPRKPAASSFVQTQRTAFVVGARDRRDLMTEGAHEVVRSGREARLFVLPEATHGAYGPEGERVMSEALTFVVSPPLPSPNPPSPSP